MRARLQSKTLNIDLQLMLQSSSTPRSMEEVWNDINLASLTSHPSSSASMIFQDFLATSKDPPPSSHHHSRLTLFGAPPPATVLSLNSVPEFHFVRKRDGDRRHKRMIKNRESAARSRARKQAYTNELELEVAHLLEENATLRKHQQQLCVAAAAAQLPKKHCLKRTSTAPF